MGFADISPSHLHGGKKNDAVDENDFQLYHRALKHLQAGVEVWLNGTGDAAFVFDSTWGGVFGCGCDYDPQPGASKDIRWCRNSYPDCPSLVDAGT